MSNEIIYKISYQQQMLNNYVIEHILFSGVGASRRGWKPQAPTLLEIWNFVSSAMHIFSCSSGVELQVLLRIDSSYHVFVAYMGEPSFLAHHNM